jgi:hypothetical protein
MGSARRPALLEGGNRSGLMAAGFFLASPLRDPQHFVVDQ